MAFPPTKTTCFTGTSTDPLGFPSFLIGAGGTLTAPLPTMTETLEASGAALTSDESEVEEAPTT